MKYFGQMVLKRKKIEIIHLLMKIITDVTKSHKRTEPNFEAFEFLKVLPASFETLPAFERNFFFTKYQNFSSQNVEPSINHFIETLPKKYFQAVKFFVVLQSCLLIHSCSHRKTISKSSALFQ